MFDEKMIAVVTLAEGVGEEEFNSWIVEAEFHEDADKFVNRAMKEINQYIKEWELEDVIIKFYGISEIRVVPVETVVSWEIEE